MLKPVDYEIIRKLHTDGWSIGRLARELHHSKKSVRKALKWDGIKPRYKMSKPRPQPVTSEVEAQVRQTLLDDKKRRKKQRHSAYKIHNILVRKGHDIGESTVRKLVRRLREELREHPPVTVPLIFDPGEEAQVDWGEAEIILQRQRIMVNVFVATLCYSRRTFIMAFPSKNLESFLEAHVRAFEHWGGVPNRMAYDNLPTAVKKILGDGTREENAKFKQFRKCHGFDVRFCTPGVEGAHEKGRVERRVATYRSDLMVPEPRVASFDELNLLLIEEADEREGRRHPERRGDSIRQVFAEETPFLKPLPAARWACCDVAHRKADGQARVRYDDAFYSLPVEYGRRGIEVRGYWDRVEFYVDVKLIGTWPRSYTLDEELYDYRHYLRLLKRTPGVTLNGKPFRQMPEPLLRYRKELLSRLDRRLAGRNLAAVLLLILDHGELAVVEAVELALLSGTVDAEAVRTLLVQMHEAPRPRPAQLNLSSRPQLDVPVEPIDLRCYDALTKEVAV